MNLAERSQLVLAYTRALYVNGQSTEQILAAAERLGDALGLRAKILPRWGELQLQAEDGDAELTCATVADPAGVDMDRVASAMQAIEELGSGRLARAAAMEAIGAISRAPPLRRWSSIAWQTEQSGRRRPIVNAKYTAPPISRFRDLETRRPIPLRSVFVRSWGGSSAADAAAPSLLTGKPPWL